MTRKTGKKFLSDIKLHSDYLKWREDLGRYETWEEACEDIIDGHKQKYTGIDIEEELSSALESMKEMKVFASQRNLQFRYPQVKRSNLRLYNCLGKETRFITDQGVFSFEDFKDGDIVNVWTHKGRWRKAIVRNYGKQQLNKIELALGCHGKTNTVRATPNHRWILKDGSETINLKVGDSLIRPEKLFNYDYDESNPLERLYWCYGYVYGDGTRTKNKNGEYKHSMVRLCGHQIKFKYRFEEMGFCTSSSLSLNGDFMTYTGTYLKTLPDIKKDRLELIKAFVCGYLDADGGKTSNSNNKYYTIQSSNEESINFIKNIFPSCGIFITKEYDLTGQKTNYGIRPTTSSFSIRDSINGNNYFKVREINEDSYEDVWCLEVEEDASFTLETGIVTGNCSVLHAVNNKIFQNICYLLINGCGVGVSLLKPFVDNISSIKDRENGTKTFVIEDSMEGWADAFGVLMSSYFMDNQPFPEYANCKIRFDYSLIRQNGSLINGGFKAPGPEPLKNSLEIIEKFLDSLISSNVTKLKSIHIFDIICHISNCILSGGVRRSALNMMVDPNDSEMIYAKTGNWRQTNPQRARSNNSVLLLRNIVEKEQFKEIVNLNDGDNDIGFAFANSWFDMFNPCFEISFTPVDTIEDLTSIKYEELDNWVKNNISNFGIQLCNLTSMNSEKIKNKEDFLRACKDEAILGTLQAGYTSFPYFKDATEIITRREALLGCSITGLMNNPKLFNKEWLQEGVKVILEVNEKLASKLGINKAARTSCVKPEGNLSVVAQTSSGINAEHSERYFRIMQINKESDVAKYLLENAPFLLEESVWSANNTDYVIFIPIVNPSNGLFKNDMKGIKHLELIKLVQENWVIPGTRKECGISPKINHNISSTVILDDKQQIIDYIWDNKDSFTAVSFISDYGDKDFNQAPFTSILTVDEIFEKYGHGALFASGLIVDGLHYFNNNLWEACDCILNQDIPISGTKEQVMLKKYWLQRAKKFAKNYFKGDLKETVYCLKDVHLCHKWETINRQMKDIDFSKVLTKPEYKDVSDYAAVACSGNSCELTKI